MPRSRRTEFRVGVFVVVAIVVGGALAFIIGNQRNVFKSKTTYFAYFNDVGGLRPGGPVRVAGVSVGTVDAVRFRDDGRVRVEFQIINRAKRLIRGSQQPQESEPGRPAPEPSVASIGTKGMLGDKLIEITVGDSSLPAWNPERPLPTSTGADLMETARSALDEVQGTAKNLRRATDPLSDQQLTHDLKETARNLAKVTGMLANGDGAIQRLMTDPQVGDQLASTLRNLQTTSTELAQTLRSVRAISNEIQQGDGSAHRLIYGSEAVDSVASLGRAGEEIATLLRDVREGDGTVHDLIYTDAANDLIKNLTDASADVAHMTSEMRAGRGTIGGLISDPSIYEDVKRLVGDLQRNEILRALIRYSIRRDEATERIDVQD